MILLLEIIVPKIANVEQFSWFSITRKYCFRRFNFQDNNSIETQNICKKKGWGIKIVENLTMQELIINFIFQIAIDNILPNFPLLKSSDFWKFFREKMNKVLRNFMSFQLQIFNKKRLEVLWRMRVFHLSQNHFWSFSPVNRSFFDWIR